MLDNGPNNWERVRDELAAAITQFMILDIGTTRITDGKYPSSAAYISELYRFKSEVSDVLNETAGKEGGSFTSHTHFKLTRLVALYNRVNPGIFDANGSRSAQEGRMLLNHVIENIFEKIRPFVLPEVTEDDADVPQALMGVVVINLCATVFRDVSKWLSKYASVDRLYKQGIDLFRRRNDPPHVVVDRIRQFDVPDSSDSYGTSENPVSLLFTEAQRVLGNVFQREFNEATTIYRRLTGRVSSQPELNQRNFFSEIYCRA
jgi:hypothetical protein